MYRIKTRKKLKKLYVIILMVVCFSCTKEGRNSSIKNELAKNNPQIEVTTSNEEVQSI